MDKKLHIATLVSHPIHYQVPMYRKLTARENVDFKAYFCWDIGTYRYDREFKKMVNFQIDLLSGYPYKFLRNYRLARHDRFFGHINPGIVWELFKERKKLDMLYVHGWNQCTLWLGFFSCFVFGIPVCLRGENPLNQELKKNGIFQEFKRFILRCLFRHISAFLYLGEENKKFYRFMGVPEEKLFFGPYTIDNEAFTKAFRERSAYREELRKKLGIKPRDPVVLFVGKVISKKGPFDILRAYHRVSCPNKRIIFVGDGDERAKLEKYVAENNVLGVVFAGFKGQQDLYDYYSMADLFVLASGIGETWGLVVNEAMCSGLPVIISDMIGCGADLVRTNENGFIFPLHDVDALANDMSILMNDPEKMKKFGVRSSEIIQGYSFDRLVDGIVETADYLARNHRG